MYKKKILLIGLLFLFGCADVKKFVGIDKEVPNEFLIEKRDPLVLPPDYKLLPPDSNNLKKENEVEKDISLESLFKRNSQGQEKEALKNMRPNASNLEQKILNQIK